MGLITVEEVVIMIYEELKERIDKLATQLDLLRGHL